MTREGLLVILGTLLIMSMVALYNQYVSSKVHSRDGSLGSGDRKEVADNTVRLAEQRVELGEWRAPVVPAHLQQVDQDDEELVQHIREHWLVPSFPAGEWKPISDRRHYSQIGQSEAIDDLLGQMTDGFFVECGAADGHFLSNTLFFEKYRGWGGLLVEVDPDAFQKILAHRRHSFMVNACLSPSRHPVVLNYTRARMMGGLDDYMQESHKKLIMDRISGNIQVQCFPLVSILKAIGITRVDYFSLDVEGPELEILRTIPLNDLYVRSLSIEYRVNKDPGTTQKKLKAIRKLMVDQYGYREVKILSNLDIILEKVS